MSSILIGTTMYGVNYQRWNKDWLQCALDFADVYGVRLHITYERMLFQRYLVIGVEQPLPDEQWRAELFHTMFSHLLRHHKADHIVA